MSSLRIGNYVLGDTIGAGSFGKVKLATHQITGHQVAVKILNREKVKNLDMAVKLKREIQILKLFRHPHIIKLYQVLSTTTEILMVMEFVPGGELFDYILKRGRVNEDVGRKFFQQILSGVDYCHRHMIVHRDLKPEKFGSLLLDKQHANVKIADFGLSNIMVDGDFLKTSCGSPNYAAPEVISGQLYAGPEVDIWSCGVILYVLLCGKLPFDDEYVPALFKKIRSGVFVMPAYLSAGANALLKAMLAVDPLKRATIASIRDTPWFQENLPSVLFCASEVEEAAQVYDDKFIARVCRDFQVYPEQVLESLQSGIEADQLVRAYHMLVENSALRPDEAEAESMTMAAVSLVNPTATRQQSAPPTAAPTATAALTLAARASDKPSPVTTHKAGVGRAGGRRTVSSVVPVVAGTSAAAQAQALQIGATAATAAASTAAAAAAAQRQLVNVKRSRWHLGMRSQNSPVEILTEVYRAMKALGFQWKIVTNYHIRCRCYNQVSKTTVNMSLKLYKADDRNFLLDFQSLPTTKDGAYHEVHTIEFFELCAMLITELGK